MGRPPDQEESVGPVKDEKMEETDERSAEKGRNVPGIPRRIPFSAGYLVIRLLIRWTRKTEKECSCTLHQATAQCQ